MKKKIVILIIFVILLAVVCLGYWYFNFYKKTPASSEKRVSNLEEEANIVSCDKFSNTTNEISCEDAKGAALKEFPGEVYEINKSDLELTPEGQNQPTKYNLWVIKVKFKEVISNSEKFPGIENVGYAEIGVDRNTKELLILGYGPPL